ncbi:MAG: hypothetical protein ABSG81_13850, partial [Acidimicrobiales bacterium]
MRHDAAAAGPRPPRRAVAARVALGTLVLVFALPVMDVLTALPASAAGPAFVQSAAGQGSN